MILTIKYKDGLRERKRTIPNVRRIDFVECHNRLEFLTNDQEHFEITGEFIEIHITKESEH